MADEAYWTYHAATPTPQFDEIPEGAFRGTATDWYSLTPGMRREIVRQFNRPVALDRRAMPGRSEFRQEP